jgi:iron only hydrogenase large subunit-like protein
VWDTTFARHLSLRETVQEFEERRMAAAASRSGSSNGGDENHGVPKPGPLPMLASACPGWVCYAEKAQADLLPLLSSVRSSQAISGALVKQWWAGRMGLRWVPRQYIASPHRRSSGA